MLSQLSDLAFFYFWYTFHDISEEQVENCHERKNLVDQDDCTTCV